AVAAHRALVSLYPNQVHRFDEALDQSLDTVPEGPAKLESIRFGQAVAEAMLELRGQDGSTARVSYRPREGAGFWRPTPPDFRAALLPQWPSLTCFCMRSGSQFRPQGPPALDSAADRASYQEVRDLGGVQSRVRTPDQTQI